jgi:hypothetical protein
LKYEEAVETLRSVPRTTQEERMEVRGRIKTIKKLRKELERRPEVDWSRKRG